MNPKLWINSFTKPKDTFQAEKGNANFKDGAINYAMAGLLVAIIGLIIGLATKISSSSSTTAILIGAPIVIIMYIILYPLAAIFGQGILYVIAKYILGGKGTADQQYYLTSLYAVPVLIISLIPIINILNIFYALYLETIAIRETHGFGTGKAVLTWLIPLIVVGILVLLVAAPLLYSSMGSMSATGYSIIPFQ